MQVLARRAIFSQWTHLSCNVIYHWFSVYYIPSSQNSPAKRIHNADSEWHRQPHSHMHRENAWSFVCGSPCSTCPTNPPQLCAASRRKKSVGRNVYDFLNGPVKPRRGPEFSSSYSKLRRRLELAAPHVPYLRMPSTRYVLTLGRHVPLCISGTGERVHMCASPAVSRPRRESRDSLGCGIAKR